MRVLEFVTNFCVGGTERQFVNLVDGLRRRDVEVHVACFEERGPLLAELHRDGLPVLPFREYPVSSLRSPTAAVRLLALARYIRRHRIELVHTTGLYPNVFGVAAARLAGTPAVASVRDMGHVWKATLLRTQRLACRLADTVVTNAEAVARRLRAEGWDGRRIEVIHNGIAAASAPVEERAAGGPSVREELGISPAAPVVGVVCRLDPVKGIEDFLAAAALVAGRLPETRFLVVGGAAAATLGRGAGEGYVERLRRRAAALGLGERVVFTGARDDVPRILQEIDVSVLSSHSEGLSNALLEAMAAARPVVATDVGGNPEIVEDGTSGFLVPPRDPAALAMATLRLLTSPRLAAEMGRAGRARVRAQFTHERMVERTLELYRRLLAGAAAAAPRRREPLRGPGVAEP